MSTQKMYLLLRLCRAAIGYSRYAIEPLREGVPVEPHVRSDIDDRKGQSLTCRSVRLVK